LLVALTVLVSALLALVVYAGTSLPRLARGVAAAGPISSVAEARANLAGRPRAWTDRPLLLRGVAVPAGTCVAPTGPPVLCAPPRVVLADADPTAAVAPLPLVWAAPDTLLAVVRRVPLLSGLLPAPEAMDWGTVATYRVELRSMPDAGCGAATCYEALLLDAAP
jgi:hypothetical protein